MLLSYIKIAWRHLVRDKVVSLISVVSLSLGIACALLVFLFLQHEWIRDDFHVNGDRTFIVYRTNEAGEGNWDRRFATFPEEAGPQIAKALPQVEGFTRWGYSGGGRLRYSDFTTRVVFAFVDSSLFSMMSFEMMHGDSQPFSTPNEVVLTARLAKRFAGEEDIASLIGKRFTYMTTYDNTLHDVIVSAIAYDPTYRSTLQFEAFLPYYMFSVDRLQRSIDPPLFVMLQEASQREAVEQGLASIADEILAEEVVQLRGAGKWSEEKSPFSLHLQPFTEAHEDVIPGSPLLVMPDDTVDLVLILGIVVLALGCINFIVLSLGRSVYRAREIGLRKVAGARRSHVIGQVVLESIVLCALALVVGVALADYLMPGLSAVFEMPNYALGWTSSWVFWAFVILLPIAVGLLSGLYPALVLSRTEPIGALKGSASARQGRLTRGLIVLQFGATIFLLANTQVLLAQIDYIREMDRGFDVGSILTIDPNSTEHVKLYERFRTKIVDLPGVENVAGGSVSLGGGARFYSSKDPDVFMFHAAVTADIVGTFGLTVIEGRNFRPDGPTDVVLVNRKMVEVMQWEDPIGQTVPFKDGDQIDHPQVVGVVENFQFTPANWTTGPLVLHRNPETRTARVFVRMTPSAIPDLLPRLKEIWKEIAPDAPSTINLMSDTVARENESLTKFLGSLGYAASGFGLLISCLGLFGVALHTLAQRVKEVGVRKVLGASITSLFIVLSTRLIILTVIGCVLGSIGAYYASQMILQDYGRQVSVGIQHFVLPSLGVVLIAFLTIAYQTLKTT